MWAARNGSLARQTENLVSSLVQPRPSHGQCMPETEHRPPAFDMLTSSEQPDMQSAVMASRCFQLILIKPSHYDDDGYVIRWWRAMIPSNSLAAVYGIAADCAERQVLGPDVDDRHRSDRRDEHAHRRAGAARPVPAPRQFRACRARWRSVEPISPRPRHRATVPRGRNPRRHGRIPCLRLPVDAGWARGRARCLPGDGHRHVCGRGRGPARHGLARRRRGPPRAASTTS